MRMRLSVRGNIISGIIAAVIFAVIAAATGGSAGVVIIGAIVIGLATLVISYLFTRAILAARNRE